MWRMGIFLLGVLALGAVPALAAEEGKPEEPAKEPAKAGAEGETKKEEAPPETPAILSEDQQKVAAIQADLMAGNTDKALEAVKEFLRDTKDEEARTDAYLVMADATRKKADWRNAPAAYQRVRDRYEKGSDKFLKYDVIATVLRASPTGVYRAPGTPPKSEAEQKTLADDAALDEAVALMISGKMEKLKTRAASLKRAASPQDLVKMFEPMVDECRQATIAAPKADLSQGREAATIAGTRMQELSTQMTATFRAKLKGYAAKMERPWGFTNVEKRDIGNYSTLCRGLAANEKSFQEQVTRMAGGGAWPEGDRIRRESESRRVSYENLAEEFVVPAYTVDVL